MKIKCCSLRECVCQFTGCLLSLNNAVNVHAFLKSANICSVQITTYVFGTLRMNRRRIHTYVTLKRYRFSKKKKERKSLFSVTILKYSIFEHTNNYDYSFCTACAIFIVQKTL